MLLLRLPFLRLVRAFAVEVELTFRIVGLGCGADVAVGNSNALPGAEGDGDEDGAEDERGDSTRRRFLALMVALLLGGGRTVSSLSSSSLPTPMTPCGRLSEEREVLACQGDSGMGATLGVDTGVGRAVVRETGFRMGRRTGAEPEAVATGTGGTALSVRMIGGSKGKAKEGEDKGGGEGRGEDRKARGSLAPRIDFNQQGGRRGAMARWRRGWGSGGGGSVNL